MLQKVMREAHSRSITPASKKLLDAAEVIRLDPGTKDDAAFVHVVMCHLGMPRSKTAERVFERAYERPHFRCGLRLEAGNLWNGKAFEEQPLPYVNSCEKAHVFGRKGWIKQRKRNPFKPAYHVVLSG